MSFWSNLRGTTLDTFRLAKKWIIDGSAATAQRTINLGNANIDLSSPTNGQALVYNGTSWVPQTVTGSGGVGNIVLYNFLVNYNDGTTTGAPAGLRRLQLASFSNGDYILKRALVTPVFQFDGTVQQYGGHMLPQIVDSSNNVVSLLAGDFEDVMELSTDYLYDSVSNSFVLEDEISMIEYGVPETFYVLFPDGATQGQFALTLEVAITS